MRLPSLPRLAKLLMMLTLPLSLVACQTTASVATSKSVSCEAFRPIYWSKLDTLDTQKQAVEHNAAWKSLCVEKK
jgi:hypothetical protein